MTRRGTPRLQLAVDVLEGARGLGAVEAAFPHFDIVEVGTPWVIEEGLGMIAQIRRRWPGKTVLADLKIMDAGRIEAGSGFRRGADIVTVLGAADDATILGAMKAVEESGGADARKIMADLINVADPVKRGKELEKMGVHILCLHTAYDRQGLGVDPLAELKAVREAVGCELAIAGGVTLGRVGQAVKEGADIVVVGGAILNASDPGKAAREFMEEMGRA